MQELPHVFPPHQRMAGCTKASTFASASVPAEIVGVSPTASAVVLAAIATARSAALAAAAALGPEPRSAGRNCAWPGMPRAAARSASVSSGLRRLRDATSRSRPSEGIKTDQPPPSLAEYCFTTFLEETEARERDG
jgi:hypothetical protein